MVLVDRTGTGNPAAADTDERLPSAKLIDGRGFFVAAVLVAVPDDCVSRLLIFFNMFLKS